MNLRFEKLTEQNFKDYESLTKCEGKGGCYCAFWHQKWTSMEAWEQRQKENPELNRQTVLDRVRSGFHVGALAYENEKLIAWISVGPMTDCYWLWRRAGQLGPDVAKMTAGITCITVSKDYRGKGTQSKILEGLKSYAVTQSWKSIEGYPFEQSAHDKQGDAVKWSGFTGGYDKAGYIKVGPHWMNHPDWERALYKFDL